MNNLKYVNSFFDKVVKIKSKKVVVLFIIFYSLLQYFIHMNFIPIFLKYTSDDDDEW